MVHIILQVIDMYDSECTMSASDLEEVADSGDADCSVGAVVKFFKFIALLVTIVPSVALFYFGIQCCACALCNLFPWNRLTLLVADCVDIRRLHAAQVWPPAQRRRDTPVDCAHRANAGAGASAAPRPTARSPTTGAATGPAIATSTGETLSDAKHESDKYRTSTFSIDSGTVPESTCRLRSERCGCELSILPA
eukprot:COSAG01_NODE_6957_length_3417_cov_9.172393_4_plen_194_part_00